MTTKIKVLRVGCLTQWKECTDLVGQIVEARVEPNGAYLNDLKGCEIYLFNDEFEIVK